MENPNIEFASAEEIKAFQEKELAKHLAYLSANSPFYKKMFKENGIDPAAIKSLEDLQKIPFTDKLDLQIHGSEFICVPPEKIVGYICMH